MGYNTEQTEVDPSSKQDGVRRDEKGRILPGSTLNPKGAGGFQDHPEIRSGGSWKREDTARYKLERMMQLTEAELNDIIDNPASPKFEQKLAKAMIDGSWPVLREMMNEVYGRPKESIDISSQDNAPPIIKGFVLPTLPEHFIDKDIIEQLGEEEAAKVLNRHSL